VGVPGPVRTSVFIISFAISFAVLRLWRTLYKLQPAAR
jgi:hypothetical protein